MAAPGQQNKMKACNERANKKGFGEGKGEERKAFMNLKTAIDAHVHA